MRSLGLSALVLLLALCTTPAAAAPAFPDVPSGHWAYDAVAFLQDLGFVEGYPDGTFSGNRQLNRYEFAIVVARLYDRLLADLETDGVLRADVDALSERLEREFAPELADLQQLVAEHDTRLGEIETAFTGLESRVGQTEADIQSLFGRLGKIAFSGDARTRLDFTSFDQPETDDRKRARIRLRLQGDAALSENVAVQFRLATGGASDLTGRNKSLEDHFAADEFNVDRLALIYADPEALGGWRLNAGKFTPNWASTPLTFDTDVTTEGLAWNFLTGDEHWRLNFAQLIPEEAGYYLVNQLGYEDLLFDGADLYLTYHHMDSDAFSLIREGAEAEGSRQRNTFTFSDFAIDSDFTQLDLLARLAIHEAFRLDYPLILTGNYLESDYDASPGGHEYLTKGALVELKGGYFKDPGDWGWAVEWGKVQPNAVQALWADEGGNREYWTAYLQYQWTKEVLFKVKYFDQQQFFPVSSPNGSQKIEIDAVAKF